jgi:hypothetical protein
MEIDYAILAAVITTGIALVTTGLGIKYRGQYQAALVVINHSAMFISGVSEVIAYSTKALADDKLTPEEVKDIVERLEKVLAFLEQLKALLGK